MLLLAEYLQHRNLLLYHATKFVKTRERAEEVVQDVYFRVRTVSEMPEDPKSFLINAVRFVAINCTRRKEDAGIVLYEPTELPVIVVEETPESIGIQTVDLAFHEQRLQTLRQHIEQLPKRTREVFKVKLTGEPLKRYSKRIGRNHETVQALFTYGIKILKKKLLV